MLRFAVFSAIASLTAGPVFAGKPAVTLAAQTFVEKVTTDVNGNERRVLTAPRQITRGDRLVFVVRYRNDGHAPVDGFALTNPIPASLRVDPNHPDMQVSVDNGRNWGRLAGMTIATPLGGVRRATADDVTHVRWMVPQAIRPGDEGRISYRATVR